MLAKIYRLKGASIPSVFKSSQSFSHPLFSLRWSFIKKPGPSQIAVIVSKKVSPSAVSRNKIKRLVSQAIFPYLPRLMSGYALVILPRPVIVKKPFLSIQSALFEVLQKARLINEKSNS